MDTTSGQPVRARPAMIMRRPVSPVARVVVGVDGSAGSAAALRWAAAEACRRQTALRIVSAWNSYSYGEPQSSAAESPDGGGLRI
ncbi:MAG: universal stress protein [Gemmatimonadales bacterium]